MRFLITFVATLAVSGCAPRSGGAAIDSEDYSVYRVVLDSLFKHQARTAFMVYDSTIARVSQAEDVSGRVRLWWPNTDPSMVASFHARNSGRVRLDHTRLVASLPIQFVDPVQLEALREETKELSGLPPRYPAEGWIILSQPGYDSARQFALISVIYFCGGRCGGVQYVLLERKAAGWVVSAREQGAMF